MPAWLLWITSASLIAHLVFKVLAALGLGLFAFVGMDIGFDHLTNLMDENLSQLPLSVVALLKMSGIITVIHWIITAWVTRVTMTIGGQVFFGRKGYQDSNIGF